PALRGGGFTRRVEVSSNQGTPIMTTRRTSLSDPLYINWIAGIVSGRVGITIAPGKQSTSLYMPNSIWRRDLATDLDTLVSLGATDLVTLLEDRDITRLAIPGLFDQARASGLCTHHLPIVDGSVPEHEAPLHALLTMLRQRLDEGASVVIHCEGGKGRSGVVAGCLLLSLGASLPQALQHLRQARGPNCPENPRQLVYLERFANQLRSW
ncbi:MAG: hypothetical protein EOP84_02790, partial [Verrucomicrobiaceae bacterium]